MRHCVQGQDAQRTIALMEAKIKRLQSIIIRNQPSGGAAPAHHPQPGAGASL